MSISSVFTASTEEVLATEKSPQKTSMHEKIERIVNAHCKKFAKDSDYSTKEFHYSGLTQYVFEKDINTMSVFVQLENACGCDLEAHYVPYVSFETNTKHDLRNFKRVFNKEFESTYSRIRVFGPRISTLCPDSKSPFTSTAKAFRHITQQVPVKNEVTLYNHLKSIICNTLNQRLSSTGYHVGSLVNVIILEHDQGSDFSSRSLKDFKPIQQNIEEALKELDSKLPELIKKYSATE